MLVLTVNVSILRQLELLAGIDRTRITATYDGNPVRFLAGREFGFRPERVTGADLLKAIPEHTAETGTDTTTVIVGSHGSADAEHLRNTYPNANIAGVSFAERITDAKSAARQIDAELPSGPKVVFLCFGYPKQEQVANELLRLSPNAVFIGAGASADFIARRASRAPRVVQRASGEWLWRLLSEPRRLGARYLRYDLPFLVGELLPARLRRKKRSTACRSATVFHFGPSVSEVGGMGSVIERLSDPNLGGRRYRAASTWWRGRPVRSALATLAQIARVIFTPNIIVHVHLSEGGSFLREGAIAAIGKLRRVPTYATLHGANFEQFAASHSNVVERVLGGLTGIFVLGPRTFRVVDSRVPDVPIHTVLNPVPDHNITNLTPSGPAQIVFVGEVGFRKGVDRLLDAWNTLEGRSSQLHLIGPLAHDYRIPETLPRNTQWLGTMPRDIARTTISQATCLVLPSRAEALPMVILEALASGTPVIATRCGDVDALADWPGIRLITNADDAHGELVEALRAAIASHPLSASERSHIAAFGARASSAAVKASYEAVYDLHGVQ